MDPEVTFSPQKIELVKWKWRAYNLKLMFTDFIENRRARQLLPFGIVVIIFYLALSIFRQDLNSLRGTEVVTQLLTTTSHLGFSNYYNATTSLPAVSKVYVINLDRRKDRLRGITKQLDALHIPFTRFPAVDFGNGKQVWDAYKGLHNGTKINLELVQKKIDAHKNTINSDYSWAQAGCWQTHLQILFDIIDNENILPGPFVILEDDAEIEPRIVDILSKKSLNEDVPKDWDILALGYDAQWCFDDVETVEQVGYFFKRVTRKGSDGPFCLASSFLNTDGYVIRNAAVAKKLLAYSNMMAGQTADTYWHPLFRSRRVSFGYITLSLFPLPPTHPIPRMLANCKILQYMLTCILCT